MGGAGRVCRSGGLSLPVAVRSGLFERLRKVAERVDRSLDYVVDEILRWAVAEYTCIGSLAGLLASEADFSDEADKAAEEELEKIYNTSRSFA